MAHVEADAETRQSPDAADAATSSPGASLYRTLIDLDSQRLSADGRQYELMPGMQVSAEIKLGTRSVLEYLLSPIGKAFHEAGRER